MPLRPPTCPPMPAVLAALAAFAGAPCHGFELGSADIAGGAALPAAQVYDSEGCRGANRSPQLSWRDAPPGTLSFASRCSTSSAIPWRRALRTTISIW